MRRKWTLLLQTSHFLSSSFLKKRNSCNMARGPCNLILLRWLQCLNTNEPFLNTVARMDVLNKYKLSHSHPPPDTSPIITVKAEMKWNSLHLCFKLLGYIAVFRNYLFMKLALNKQPQQDIFSVNFRLNDNILMFFWIASYGTQWLSCSAKACRWSVVQPLVPCLNDCVTRSCKTEAVMPVVTFSDSTS